MTQLAVAKEIVQQFRCVIGIIGQVSSWPWQYLIE
jgi:hypothetical protein